MNTARQDEIYELQSKLRKIAQTNKNMKVIAPDGIFGSETETAVKEFQALYGLPVTGIVDFATWNKVMQEYANAVYKTSPGLAIIPFPNPDYKTYLGEKSDIIYIIQIILSAVAVVYDDFENIVPSGIFDEETSDAIRRFQEINRLPVTGIVDKQTWNTLANNYNIFSDNSDYTS